MDFQGSVLLLAHSALYCEKCRIYKKGACAACAERDNESCDSSDECTHVLFCDCHREKKSETRKK